MKCSPSRSGVSRVVWRARPQDRSTLGPSRVRLTECWPCGNELPVVVIAPQLGSGGGHPHRSEVAVSQKCSVHAASGHQNRPRNCAFVFFARYAPGGT